VILGPDPFPDWVPISCQGDFDDLFSLRRTISCLGGSFPDLEIFHGISWEVMLSDKPNYFFDRLSFLGGKSILRVHFPGVDPFAAKRIAPLLSMCDPCFSR
jgi:hypothetical protein